MAAQLQILLHADADNDGSAAMAEHLQLVLGAALARFGERVTRVEVQLAGGARAGHSDSRCTLQARLAHDESVVVSEHAGSAHQAISSAARKLKRATGVALAKHDPRQQRDRAAIAGLAAGLDPVA